MNEILALATICFVSDSLFFLGGVFYLIASSVEIHSGIQDSCDWLDVYDWSKFLGPFLYLCYAIIELALAIDNWRRHRRQGLKRHAASWDVCGNVFLGLGAMTGLIAFSKNCRGDEKGEENAGLFSIHFYLLSFLATMAGTKLSWSLDEIFFEIGHVLFGIGSIIDIVITYASFTIATDYFMAVCRLISNLLWTIDGILYVMGDLVLFMNLRDQKRRDKVQQLEEGIQLSQEESKSIT